MWFCGVKSFIRTGKKDKGQYSFFFVVSDYKHFSVASEMPKAILLHICSLTVLQPNIQL